jgi:hypothetical protein
MLERLLVWSVSMRSILPLSNHSGTGSEKPSDSYSCPAREPESIDWLAEFDQAYALDKTSLQSLSESASHPASSLDEFESCETRAESRLVEREQSLVQNGLSRSHGLNPDLVCGVTIDLTTGDILTHSPIELLRSLSQEEMTAIVGGIAAPMIEL